MNNLSVYLQLCVNMAGVNIKNLLYADDIVILADSPSDLQTMIDCLHNYCMEWSLNVNLAKSQILIFRAGNRLSSNLHFRYGDHGICIVNTYKYLGIELSFKLSFKIHLANKLASCKLAINSTWSSYISQPQITKALALYTECRGFEPQCGGRLSSLTC